MKKYVILYTIVLCSLCLHASAQLIRTSLHLIVRNELGNPESEVNVRLFRTKEAYDKLQDQATPTLKTDKNGKVVFKELEPAVYYINAEKESRNNFGAGERTDTLSANRINKITVVITE